jgi:hypothetical protein
MPPAAPPRHALKELIQHERNHPRLGLLAHHRERLARPSLQQGLMASDAVKRSPRTTHTHAKKQACVHTHAHTYTHICTHIHTHTNTERAEIHTHTHTHTNTHTHTHTHTHRGTPARMQTPSRCSRRAPCPQAARTFPHKFVRCSPLLCCTVSTSSACACTHAMRRSRGPYARS